LCDHRLQDALKPAKVSNLAVNRLQVRACHGVDFTASQRALVDQPEHGANFVQSEAEFTASLDERKTPELFIREYAMAALASRRPRHNADPFIISDGLDIDARSPRQLADK